MDYIKEATWHIQKVSPLGADRDILEIRNAYGDLIAECTDWPDANTLVRAVNSHEALVAACKVAVADIERLYAGQPEGNFEGNAAVKALRAALAEAEKE